MATRMTLCLGTKTPAVLAERYRKLGGSITLIPKSGSGIIPTGLTIQRRLWSSLSSTPSLRHEDQTQTRESFRQAHRRDDYGTPPSCRSRNAG